VRPIAPATICGSASICSFAHATTKERARGAAVLASAAPNSDNTMATAVTSASMERLVHTWGTEESRSVRTNASKAATSPPQYRSTSSAPSHGGRAL
jgi:hypothetical protein